MKKREKLKAQTAKEIVDLLASKEGLTVADGAEVLMACNNLIKERTYKAMAEEEARPLTDALDHLNRSDIKIVGSLQ